MGVLMNTHSISGDRIARYEGYGPISTSDGKLANAVTDWGRSPKEDGVRDLSE